MFSRSDKLIMIYSDVTGKERQLPSVSSRWTPLLARLHPESLKKKTILKRMSVRTTSGGMFPLQRALEERDEVAVWVKHPELARAVLSVGERTPGMNDAEWLDNLI